jgi:hypothetical protein
VDVTQPIAPPFDEPCHQPGLLPQRLSGGRSVYPQHELRVDMPTGPVQIRYWVARRPDRAADGAGRHADAAARAGAVFPEGHRAVLFIHGHSSSADEALDFAPLLDRAGQDVGVDFSLISFDFPSNGYSTMIDPWVAAPQDPDWPGLPTDNKRVITPLIDYLEDFIVAFADALERIAPFQARFAGVIGGNLGLRLGRRAEPWLQRSIVSWDPASVWAPQVADIAKGIAPDKTIRTGRTLARPSTSPVPAGAVRRSTTRRSGAGTTGSPASS